MWICEECGLHFEEPRTVGKKQSYFTEGFYTSPESYKCPYCGSEYVELAARCKGCGEWHVKDEGNFCNSCEEKYSEIASKAARTGDEVIHDIITTAARGNIYALQYMEACL